MKLTRHTIQACCGRTSIIFKIDQPIDRKLLDFLTKIGFNEAAHFTKNGLLYVDNLDFIVTGPFGSDKLQVKCRKLDCQQKLNDFEALLSQMG